MSGEWISSDDSGVKAFEPNNNVLGHVVHRLLDIVHPPPPSAPPPKFPPFPIKGCVLGKMFSGKTNCLKHLAQAHGVRVLNVDLLVKEAKQAFEDKEMEEEADSATADSEQLIQENKMTNDVLGPEAQSTDSITATAENDAAMHEVTQDSTAPKEKKPSARARLGEMVEQYLKRGKAVPDELLIDILIASINHIPENCGWILDGFPSTLNQAKLLEKALTGYDPDKMAARTRKNVTLTLVKDPAATEDAPPPAPGLDFAALIDVSDNVVLQRTAGLCGQGQDPSITADAGGYSETLSQIQHRITGFLDNWQKLELWFSQQANLVKVDGEVEEDILCKKLEEVFLSTIYTKQTKGKETEKKEEMPPLPATPPPPSPPPPPPVASSDERPSSPDKKTSAKKPKGKSRSPKDSSVEKKKPNTPRAKDSAPSSSKDSSEEKKKPNTPRGKDSAPNSPKGSARGRSPGKKNKSVPVTPEPRMPSPVGPPPIQPGSAEWEYVNEPLPKDIPESLVPYWEAVERNYETTIKAELRSMREERFTLIHYLHDIRNTFKDYLERPDHRQEFVSQWQSVFNSLDEDKWEDDETNAELYQRLDDLRDRLWDLCDNRKEENEQERSDLINDGRLQDHWRIRINHFFSMMQVEVDRFQGSMRFLHNYYQGMQDKIPTEISQDIAQIPLLNMTNSSLQEESEQPRRIPLVPRTSPEQSSAKQRNKPSAVKGKDDSNMETTKQTSESDQKIIYDTWQTALSIITNMLTTEKQALEAEEEKERQILEIKERERVKASQATSRDSVKGGKKKSAKSPNRKKGGKSPGPAPPSPPSSAPEDILELQKKQELKIKMKQEYFAALECAEAAVNLRLELIKMKALEVYKDIAARMDQANKDMNLWLGERFLAEMSSIDKLIQVARHHIETRTKIQYQLVLEQTDFYINYDVKVLPDPVPPPFTEPSEDAILTIDQLYRLQNQFLTVAPEGVISTMQFADILVDLTTMNPENDALPELWMHLTPPEIQEITLALSAGSAMVDWRMFLLLASLPWPYPSLLQLLETRQKFQAADDSACGSVGEDTYNQTGLWFKGDKKEKVPEDPSEPIPSNRPKVLIKFFFDLFANQNVQPAQLHYIDMLLYFGGHPDPMEGFYRALGVVIGKRVVIKADNEMLVKSSASRDETENPVDGSLESNEADLLKDTEEATITLREVLVVFKQGAGEAEETNIEEMEANTYKTIVQIFSELSPESTEPIPVTALMKHPIFHDLVKNCQLYQLPDIHSILQRCKPTHVSEDDTLTSSPTGV